LSHLFPGRQKIIVVQARPNDLVYRPPYAGLAEEALAVLHHLFRVRVLGFEGFRVYRQGDALCLICTDTMIRDHGLGYRYNDQGSRFRVPIQ
jgi:hypothetical protein